MESHPYVTEDYPLIQDLMMTKVVFLLATEAETQEWHHELREMRRASVGTWEHQNAPLFDYTIGRFIVAAFRVRGHDAVATEDVPEALSSYLTSIEGCAYATAMARRDALNNAASTQPSNLQLSTSLLIAVLLQLSKVAGLKDLILALPPEYTLSLTSS